jgi:hypothetical protein
MKTKDEIIIKNKYCRPHRLPHFGKLYVNEPCHFHKKKIHQLHSILYCKLIRCPNYELMIKKQKEYNKQNV